MEREILKITVTEAERGVKVHIGIGDKEIIDIVDRNQSIYKQLFTIGHKCSDVSNKILNILNK